MFYTQSAAKDHVGSEQKALVLHIQFLFPVHDIYFTVYRIGEVWDRQMLNVSGRSSIPVSRRSMKSSDILTYSKLRN